MENVVQKINNLSIGFRSQKGEEISILKNITTEIKRGETVGIVGESGSGKTSLILALLKLISFKGKILFNNLDISKLKSKDLIKIRKDMQIIFQDPFSSLSPRMTVEEIVREGLDIHMKKVPIKEKQQMIIDILNEVGLNYDDVRNRFPHEFSGGQRQRIAIARAIILRPKLLILDEPTSALDVSIQNQIIKLLVKLQKKYELSYIFISHDIKVIRSVSDYIIVLKKGEIVEEGSAEEVFNLPKSNYTKELLTAVI